MATVLQVRHLLLVEIALFLNAMTGAPEALPPANSTSDVTTTNSSSLTTSDVTITNTSSLPTSDVMTTNTSSLFTTDVNRTNSSSPYTTNITNNKSATDSNTTNIDTILMSESLTDVVLDTSSKGTGDVSTSGRDVMADVKGSSRRRAHVATKNRRQSESSASHHRKHVEGDVRSRSTKVGSRTPGRAHEVNTSSTPVFSDDESPWSDNDGFC